MDTSTEHVTIDAVIIQDILSLFRKSEGHYEDLHQIASGYDLSKPRNRVPMQLYNDLCDWIERNLGEYNLRHLGRKISETVYAGMIENQLLGPHHEPLEVVQALKTIANLMVQDPKGRGWEILDHGEDYIIMRRTQTFNGTLQFGLIHGLVRKTEKEHVEVEYLSRFDRGAAFDEYKVSWKN